MNRPDGWSLQRKETDVQEAAFLKIEFLDLENFEEEVKSLVTAWRLVSWQLPTHLFTLPCDSRRVDVDDGGKEAYGSCPVSSNLWDATVVSLFMDNECSRERDHVFDLTAVSLST